MLRAAARLTEVGAGTLEAPEVDPQPMGGAEADRAHAGVLPQAGEPGHIPSFGHREQPGNDFVRTPPIA